MPPDLTQDELVFRVNAYISRHGEDPVALAGQNEDPDEMLVSVLRSLKEEQAGGPESVFGRGGDMVSGLDKYETGDLGWVGSLLERLIKGPLPYPAGQPARVRATGPLRIAISGDWGTGMPTSELIGRGIADAHPHFTVHLGDVYYSGTRSESQRFTNRWPVGSQGAFSLNSNHEMYSGGEGYFGVTLPSPRFVAQGGYPSFTLDVGAFRFIALDTAYWGRDYMYQKGALGPQTAWLRSVAAEANHQGQRVVLLTHHDALGMDGQPNPFWDEVMAALPAQPPSFWYWGHVHVGLAFKPVSTPGGVVHARCVGHGGIPYLPLSADEARVFAWAETRKAGDASVPERANNGFVILDVDGEDLSETFVDEHGAVAAKFKNGEQIV